MKLCTILCFDISKSNKREKCKTAFNKKYKMYDKKENVPWNIWMRF